MTKAFITILNGVITGKHHGDVAANLFGTPFFGHEKIEVPFEAFNSITPLEKTEFYTEKWKRKSDAALIEAGLLPMPSGYVVDSGELRPMTETELVEAGLLEKPGYKLEGGQLVPMTMSEQMAAGEITQQEYEHHAAEASTAELQRRLSELQTPEVLAEAEIDEEFAAERKAKLAALLAVKKQSGWPLDVQWPDAAQK